MLQGVQDAAGAQGGKAPSEAAARAQPAKRTYTPRRQAARAAAMELDVQARRMLVGHVSLAHSKLEATCDKQSLGRL